MFEARFYKNHGEITVEETHYQKIIICSSGNDRFGEYFYSIGETKIQAVHNLGNGVKMHIDKIQKGLEKLTNLEHELMEVK